MAISQKWLDKLATAIQAVEEAGREYTEEFANEYSFFSYSGSGYHKGNYESRIAKLEHLADQTVQSRIQLNGFILAVDSLLWTLREALKEERAIEDARIASERAKELKLKLPDQL